MLPFLRSIYVMCNTWNELLQDAYCLADESWPSIDGTEQARSSAQWLWLRDYIPNSLAADLVRTNSEL